MSDNDHFLSRWSRRKHAAARGETPAEPAVPNLPPTAAPADAAPVPAVPAAAPAPLPDVETLTADSDFTPFMQSGVAEPLRQRALKTLFGDPRFNVMDGLDVYIDDYSKPDPLPEGWLEKLNQVARLGEYKPPEPQPGRPAKNGEGSGLDPAAQIPSESDTSVPVDPDAPVRES